MLGKNFMNCPVCEKEIEPKLKRIWNDYKLLFCPECEVIFADPMKNPGREWYEQEIIYEIARIVVHGNIEWYHQYFLNYKKIGDTLFDVGCGIGRFLNKARIKGYKVTGIDFDRRNIKICKTVFKLFDVYDSTLEDFRSANPNRFFDVITLFETLEHVDNPPYFIKQIKSILKPDGYIALSVPNRERNIDPLRSGDMPPNHLTWWNKKTLSDFLERNGFIIVSIIEKPIDADDIANLLKYFFIVLLKSKFSIIKKTVEKSVETGQGSRIRIVKFLIKIWLTFFNCISFIIKQIFKIFSLSKVIKLKGQNLFCLARLNR